MNNACKMACAYFNSIGFKYRLFNDEKSQIFVNFNADNLATIEIKVFFDDNNRSVALRCFNFVKNIPDSKRVPMMIACNELNHKYRWVKFYVDTEDNTISIEDDAIISLDTVGDEIKELCNRLANIADESYPLLMKIVYGA